MLIGSNWWVRTLGHTRKKKGGARKPELRACIAQSISIQFPAMSVNCPSCCEATARPKALVEPPRRQSHRLLQHCAAAIVYLRKVSTFLGVKKAFSDKVHDEKHWKRCLWPFSISDSCPYKNNVIYPQCTKCSEHNFFARSESLPVGDICSVCPVADTNWSQVGDILQHPPSAAVTRVTLARSILCATLALVSTWKAPSSIPSKARNALGTAVDTSSGASLAGCSTCFATPIRRQTKAVPACITTKVKVAHIAAIHLALGALCGACDRKQTPRRSAKGTPKINKQINYVNSK